MRMRRHNVRQQSDLQLKFVGKIYKKSTSTDTGGMNAMTGDTGTSTKTTTGDAGTSTSKTYP